MKMRKWKRGLWTAQCVGLLVLSTSTLAAPRVVVAPFTGPKGALVREQVVKELCKKLDCVPSKSVVEKGKLDWKKVAKQSPAAVVTANVNAVGKLAAVYVTILGADKKELAGKKRWALKAFKLSSNDLGKIIAHVSDHVEGGEAPPPKEPEPEPVAKRGKTEPEKEPEEPPAEPEPEPVAKRESAPAPKPEPEAPAPVATGESLKSAPLDDPEAIVEPKPRAGPLFNGSDDVQLRGGSPTVATIEVGTDLYSRRFDYTLLSSTNLRRYNAALVVSPQVTLQVFPLAGTKSLLGGLGVEGAFSLAVGLSSRTAKDAPPHPTSLTRLDLALKYGLRPIKASDLAITAIAGYRRGTFSVGAAEDGTLIEGIPSVTYSALRFGLSVEVPLAERFSPFLKLYYLPVLSSGELVSAKYFPKGGASGLELSLGTGIVIIKHWEVRLAAQLTRYGFDFKTEPTDTFVAAGAVDLYVGGTVALRYVF